jgi:putative transposase
MRGSGEADGLGRRASRGQLELRFPSTWGGARKGAGRKRLPHGNVPHRTRPVHRVAEPVHVTLRARLAPLRSQHLFPTVRLALLRASRREPQSFRILHYSIQHNHIHLIVEAQDERALSSGVRSIAIRVARYVNDLLRRRGSLWSDRWHGHALKTPREVRNAIVYVLANFRKHARTPRAPGIDPFSSGAWFDGWDDWSPRDGRAPPWAERAAWCAARPQDGDEATACVVSTAQSWLGHVGWRQHGLVRLTETPRS